jgi:hypothetical protein
MLVCFGFTSGSFFFKHAEAMHTRSGAISTPKTQAVSKSPAESLLRSALVEEAQSLKPSARDWQTYKGVVIAVNDNLLSIQYENDDKPPHAWECIIKTPDLNDPMKTRYNQAPGQCTR